MTDITLWTTAEVAATLRVHLDTVRRWGQDKNHPMHAALRPIKVGQEWRWPADLLDLYRRGGAA